MNSVPVFHDDVTYILQPEIPDYTVPYIDDIPLKGPPTRYMRSDRSYETIPANPGIRRFVWEHFQNLNRITENAQALKLDVEKCMVPIKRMTQNESGRREMDLSHKQIE